MDDDVMPEPTALTELVAAYERNFTSTELVGFLVAQSVDAQGRANNVPAIDTRPRRAGECASWGQFLDQGIASVRGTAVAGMLMPRSTYALRGVAAGVFFSPKVSEPPWAAAHRAEAKGGSPARDRRFVRSRGPDPITRLGLESPLSGASRAR
jgi:hypothetical protein